MSANFPFFEISPRGKLGIHHWWIFSRLQLTSKLDALCTENANQSLWQSQASRPKLELPLPNKKPTSKGRSDNSEKSWVFGVAEDSQALRLKSELFDLRVANANPAHGSEAVSGLGLRWLILLCGGQRWHVRRVRFNVRATGPQKRKSTTSVVLFLWSGDPYGNRTHVTAVKGPCLNRLTNGPIMVADVGFEPTTYRVWTGRSSQLS